MLWDVFISHAGEDKESVVRPLSALLEAKGLRVWVDEQQIFLGDSISQKINDGLAFSRFGVVIISESYLGKDDPKKELQALLSRQSSESRYILPVRHRVEVSTIKQKIALLGDSRSVSTSDGLEYVAREIVKAASGVTGIIPETREVRYFKQFSFPCSLLNRAVDANRLLCLKDTWRHLEIRRDMGNPDTWMGSDAEVLISIFFDLYAPIVHFQKLRYGLERTLSTLVPVDKICFGLFEAALKALVEENNLAASDPRLAYTPRVSNWRGCRAINPAQYWWQGVTVERLNLAMPLFYSPSRPDSLPDVLSFRGAYAAAYRSQGCGQRTLGVLANALYGFIPKTRPVYWRLLKLWQAIYARVLSLPSESTEEAWSASAILQWSPDRESLFSEVSEDDLPESAEDTIAALCNYFQDFMRPRFKAILAAAEA